VLSEVEEMENLVMNVLVLGEVEEVEDLEK
jgi:hypothetical protein